MRCQHVVNRQPPLYATLPVSTDDGGDFPVGTIAAASGVLESGSPFVGSAAIASDLLVAGTAYDVWVVAQDSEDPPNLMPEAQLEKVNLLPGTQQQPANPHTPASACVHASYVLLAHTPDFDPPTFMTGTPSVLVDASAQAGAAAATLSAGMSEPGTLFWLVTPDVSLDNVVVGSFELSQAQAAAVPAKPRIVDAPQCDADLAAAQPSSWPLFGSTAVPQANALVAADVSFLQPNTR